MDYYNQIFCRFQKRKGKVPPPSLLSNDLKKSFFFKMFSNDFFLLVIFFRPYKDFLSKILVL